MIVCESRALSECIRDRCKRTGIGAVLRITKQTQVVDNLLLKCSLPFNYKISYTAYHISHIPNPQFDSAVINKLNYW